MSATNSVNGVMLDNASQLSTQSVDPTLMQRRHLYAALRQNMMQMMQGGMNPFMMGMPGMQNMMPGGQGGMNNFNQNGMGMNGGWNNNATNNNVNMNNQGIPTGPKAQRAPFAHQQASRGNDDDAYMRKPLNPHRAAGRTRRVRPTDFKEL